MARPSDYTPALAAEICRRISDGESLRGVCRDDSMPCTSTVMKWAAEKPEFSEQYAKAREFLIEHWAEDILEIADDGRNDWMERYAKDAEGNPDKGWQVNGEHIQRSRLRSDNRKWLLARLAAKKYGDKLELGGEVNHNVRLVIRD